MQVTRPHLDIVMFTVFMLIHGVLVIYLPLESGLLWWDAVGEREGEAGQAADEVAVGGGQ